jgi:hypothetical protein
MGRLSTLESATNCGQAWDSAEPVARVPGQRVIISIVTLATAACQVSRGSSFLEA